MGSVDNAAAAGSVAEAEEEEAEEEGDRGDRAAEETDRSGNGFCLCNLVSRVRRDSYFTVQISRLGLGKSLYRSLGLVSVLKF